MAQEIWATTACIYNGHPLNKTQSEWPGHKHDERFPLPLRSACTAGAAALQIRHAAKVRHHLGTDHECRPLRKLEGPTYTREKKLRRISGTYLEIVYRSTARLSLLGIRCQSVRSH